MLFPLFLIFYLFLLIPAVNAKTFNPTAEFVIPTETPNNETKGKIESHPLTTEMKMKKCPK